MTFDELNRRALPELVRLISADPTCLANRVVVVTEDGAKGRVWIVTLEQLAATSWRHLVDVARPKMKTTSSPVLLVTSDLEYVFADFEWAK